MKWVTIPIIPKIFKPLPPQPSYYLRDIFKSEKNVPNSPSLLPPIATLDQGITSPKNSYRQNTNV